jgi:hypothetical protein
MYGLSLLLTVSLMAGCVERKYVITTDPPGAIVYRNGVYLGATPVDDHFVYYGKYHYTIVREGYETLQVIEPIDAPWYQWLGVDFVAENLWPFTTQDIRRFHYQLQPVQSPEINEELERARQLRIRGRELGPLPGTAPPPPPIPAPPPGALGQ